MCRPTTNNMPRKWSTKNRYRWGGKWRTTRASCEKNSPWFSDRGSSGLSWKITTRRPSPNWLRSWKVTGIPTATSPRWPKYSRSIIYHPLPRKNRELGGKIKMTTTIKRYSKLICSTPKKITSRVWLSRDLFNLTTTKRSRWKVGKWEKDQLLERRQKKEDVVRTQWCWVLPKQVRQKSREACWIPLHPATPQWNHQSSGTKKAKRNSSRWSAA